MRGCAHCSSHPAAGFAVRFSFTATAVGMAVVMRAMPGGRRRATPADLVHGVGGFLCWLTAGCERLGDCVDALQTFLPHTRYSKYFLHSSLQSKRSFKVIIACKTIKVYFSSPEWRKHMDRRTIRIRSLMLRCSGVPIYLFQLARACVHVI